MNPFAAIAAVAEQKIQEAARKGEFDHLPGAGKPLVLDDLSHLPPESRMAYTLLKNSGYIDADGAGVKTSLSHELRANAPEESVAHRQLKRLGVMMRRVRKAQGSTDHSLPPVLNDSPYLENLLKHL